MPALGTRLRYGAVAQSFHWLTVLLVAVAYLTGEGGPPSRVFGPENASTLIPFVNPGTSLRVHATRPSCTGNMNDLASG